MFSLFQGNSVLFIIQFIEGKLNLRHFVSNINVISYVISQCSQLKEIVPTELETQRDNKLYLLTINLLSFILRIIHIPATKSFKILHLFIGGSFFQEGTKNVCLLNVSNINVCLDTFYQRQSKFPKHFIIDTSVFTV